MKKLFISASIILASVTGSFASTKTENPAEFKNYNKLATANQVTWKITNQFKKASLLVSGEKTEVFYSTEGRLIGTSKSFAYDKLPKMALRNISLNYAYPEYSLIECIVFEKAFQETNYYVSFKKGNEQINLQINVLGEIEELKD
jgi:hypothetical protein